MVVMGHTFSAIVRYTSRRLYIWISLHFSQISRIIRVWESASLLALNRWISLGSIRGCLDLDMVMDTKTIPAEMIRSYLWILLEQRSAFGTDDLRRHRLLIYSFFTPSIPHLHSKLDPAWSPLPAWNHSICWSLRRDHISSSPIHLIIVIIIELWYPVEFLIFFFFNSFLLRDNTPLMLLLFHLIETERWKKYSMGEWLRNTEWPVTYLSSYLGHPTPPSRGRDWISPERGDNEEYELYPRRTYSVIPLSQNWTYFMKDSTSEGIVYFMWERGLRAGIYKDPISFWFFFLDWLDIFSLISFMYLWILTCVCMYHSIYDVSSMEVWNYYSTSSHLTIMHRITVYRSICV